MSREAQDELAPRVGVSRLVHRDCAVSKPGDEARAALVEVKAVDSPRLAAGAELLRVAVFGPKAQASRGSAGGEDQLLQ